MRFPHKVR